MELLIASNNLHKVRELKDMLSTFPEIDVVNLRHFPEYHRPNEPGYSFSDNASFKACHAAQHLNRWTLADDSGLVIPALEQDNNKDQRYNGTGNTEAESRHNLLIKMKDMYNLKRAAYFKCSLALASPEGLIKAASGACEGLILQKERGSHGFGFDALFTKHDYDKSFAELDDPIRNRVSHRRKAFDKLLGVLEKMVSESDALLC